MTPLLIGIRSPYGTKSLGILVAISNKCSWFLNGILISIRTRGLLASWRFMIHGSLPKPVPVSSILFLPSHFESPIRMLLIAPFGFHLQ